MPYRAGTVREDLYRDQARVVLMDGDLAVEAASHHHPARVTSSSELGEQLRMPGAAVHAVHEDLGAQLHERAPQIVRGPHRGSAAHDEDRLVSLRGQLGRQRVESPPQGWAPPRLRARRR